MISDLALTLGATMRLTRLVVTDDLGQWWLKDPLDRWIEERRRLHQRAHPRTLANTRAPFAPWWLKYRDGLDCPFCVGFWIGAAVLLLQSRGGKPWRFVAAALTLNEAAAHLGVRLGDAGYEDD